MLRSRELARRALFRRAKEGPASNLATIVGVATAALHSEDRGHKVLASRDVL